MKKKNIDNMDMVLAAAVSDANVPVLILDTRWHELFPPGQKPETIARLEEQLSELLKEQGKLVNECKSLKSAKKKLMDGIVANMGNNSEKKSKQSQKLLLEMNERIDVGTNRILELPGLIKEANARLLTEGVKIAYRDMQGTEETLEILTKEIEELRLSLEQRELKRDELEDRRDKVYSYMYNLLGPEIIELFDK